MATSKEFLERRTKRLNSHGIETGLCAKPMYTGYACSLAKLLVHMEFMLNCKVFGLHRLKFDEDILSRQDVTCKVDIAYAHLRMQSEIAMLWTYQMNQTQAYFASYTSRPCEPASP